MEQYINNTFQGVQNMSSRLILLELSYICS